MAYFSEVLGKTVKEYHGPWGESGRIEPLPGVRRDYKGKNPAGGRKVLASYIGACDRGRKWRNEWDQGIEGGGHEVSVRLVSDDGQLTLLPNDTKSRR